jgi:hypothetical protein
MHTGLRVPHTLCGRRDCRRDGRSGRGAAGIRDVAIHLGNSFPTEYRREHHHRWLRRYHEVLVESGVDVPSFETLWLRIRRTVICSWMAAATTASMGRKWQPIEVGMIGMTGAIATWGDVGTVEALREAL